MTPIRLVALDLDGTLLLDDHATVSPGNRKALDAAAAAGVRIVFATGRSFSAVAPSVRALPCARLFVTCNGSSVTDRNGRILKSAPIPNDRAKELLVFLSGCGRFPVELCADGKMFISGRDWEERETLRLPDWHARAFESGGAGEVVRNLPDVAGREGTAVEKISLPYLTPGQKEAVRRTLLLNYGTAVSVFSTAGHNLEISDGKADKGWGLRQVCARLGIRTADCVAIGDADNDVPMLRTAGIGVAMGNAVPAARAVADFVTRTNGEDGVSFALSRLGILS